MEIIKLSKIVGGQDGAIYNNFLFRFSSKGGCTVYDMKYLTEEAVPFAEFKLDGLDMIVPHSNSVIFGNEFFAPDDEFPLLYSNVYNNYAKPKTSASASVAFTALCVKATSFRQRSYSLSK